MTTGSQRPSIPVAIASILLISGLAATAVVMSENPPPVSSLVPTLDGTPVIVASSPLASAAVAGVSVTAAPSGSAASSPSVAPVETPAPTTPAAPPTEAPPSAAPTDSPVPSPAPTAKPTPKPTPRVARTPKKSAVPTRIQLAGLDVDLAVIAPLGRGRPRCDVAEWLEPLKHPAAGGTTYIYANAIKGMFGPIYTAVRKDADSVIGELVTVWTSDDFAWTYKVTSVRRHQTTIDWAFSLPGRTLVVQTADSGGVMMLIAREVAHTPSERDEAHPKAKPRTCP